MESQSEIGRPLWYHLVIPSDPGSARPVQYDIANLLATLPLNPRDLAGIKIALEEALVNAIKHGNRHDREKRIVIAYKASEVDFVMRITDEGDGFDSTNVPDPTTPQNLERPSGRGVLLMRRYMTEVKYNDRGNSVEMTKVFKITDDAS